MVLDLLSLVGLFGSPIGYVVVGFALYKVYNRMLSTERYAKKANHNTTVIMRSMIRQRLLTTDEIKDFELED